MTLWRDERLESRPENVSLNWSLASPSANLELKAHQNLIIRWCGISLLCRGFRHVLATFGNDPRSRASCASDDGANLTGSLPSKPDDSRQLMSPNVGRWETVMVQERLKHLNMRSEARVLDRVQRPCPSSLSFRFHRRGELR